MNRHKSIIRNFGCFCVLLLLVQPKAVFAHTETLAPTDSVVVDSLLLKMSYAAKSVSYSGIQERTMMHVGKRIRFRWQVYHWAPNRTLIQFIAPDTLRNTIFYKDGKIIKTSGDPHIGKALSKEGVSQLLQDGKLLQEIELLKQNYDVRITPSPTYLNRRVLVLSIEPKYPGRPAFYGKLDAETGLLLESRRTPAQAVADSAEQTSRFVEIHFSPPDDNLINRKFTTVDRLHRRRSSKKYEDMASLLGSYTETLLIPEKLPAGFKLRKIRAFQQKNKAFVHLLYGDGFSVVSLFQRKNGDRNWHERKARRSESASLSMAQGVKAGVHYHIVGEIALAELEEIAAGLVPIVRKTEEQQNIYLIGLLALVIIGVFYFANRFRAKSND